jgi:XRE family transcriptional regulator, regulator of sulfur utilization
MITRRDLLVALPAVAAMGGTIAAAETKPVMRSSVFEWESIPVKETKVGSVRQFFSAPTVTLENLELHVTTLDCGEMPHQPHRHPNEEMIIIRQGILETLSNGEWKRVGPGSVIFNGSDQLHGLRNVGPEQAVYHVINWKSSTTPAE